MARHIAPPGSFSDERIEEGRKGGSGRGRFVNKHMSNCLPRLSPGYGREGGRKKARERERAKYKEAKQKRGRGKEELSHKDPMRGRRDTASLSPAFVRYKEYTEEMIYTFQMRIFFCIV